MKNKFFNKKVANKKVANDIGISKKERDILRELFIRREGLRVETINKLIDLPKRTIYRKLNKLKSRGLVEDITPIWKIVNGQVNFCHSLLGNNKIFELHNLSYILKLIKVPDWWNKRKPRLSRLKGWNFKHIAFGKGGSNPYQQLINENWVIQTYPESIILIARKRYYSNNPFEAITEAINDVVDIIAYLEERLKFRLFPNEIPILEIRNNDFLRIKDYLAEHCKKQGKRFLVEIDKNRKVWVDYSEPFGKEANYPEGQEILEKVTKDYLLKKPMLNSELQMAIQQVTQNQLMFNQNFETHVKAVRQLGNNADANTKSIELLADTILDLKEEIKKINGKN